MKNLKYKYLWLMIGYAMIAFVVYSSLTSSPVTMDFKLSDKLMHIAGYFGLMGWFIQIYNNKQSQLILAICFICMGIGLEFLQGIGGVRFFELNDMLANMAGVILAWLLVKTPFPETLYWFENRFLKA